MKTNNKKTLEPESGISQRLDSRRGQRSIWRQKVPISVLLWVALSVLALVFLNKVTAGTGDTCSWSLFGIWQKEIGYLSRSTTLMHDIGYLFVGGGSRWLWLYTFLHCVPAVTLGWAGAAIISMVGFVRGQRARGMDGSVVAPP